MATRAADDSGDPFMILQFVLLLNNVYVRAGEIRAGDISSFLNGPRFCTKSFRNSFLRWSYFRLNVQAVSKMRAKRVIKHKQMGQSIIYYTYRFYDTATLFRPFRYTLLNRRHYDKPLIFGLQRIT